MTFATELYAPNVQLAKSVIDVNGGSVEPGDTLRYTITATNTGPDDATAVTIHDPIPGGTTFVPGSLSPAATSSFNSATQEAVFNVGAGATSTTGGTLAADGGTATASFDVTVDSVPSGTRIENTATASFFASTLGTSLSAQSAATTSTVAAPDLTITKSPRNFTAALGGDQTFTLRVTNSGNAPTDGSTVTVTDAFAGVPPGAFDTITAVSGSGWSCTPATPASTPATVQCTRTDVLAAGDSYPPISITAQVGGLPNDNIVNTATVTGGGDGDTTNNSTTATGQTTARADVQMTKTASTATALTGQQVTFTMRVRNAGPSTAQDVTVTDTDLAANYTVDSVSSSQGSCTALPCSLGSLGSGAEATVTVVATVTAGGPGVVSADNTAQASSTTQDPDPTNNSSTVSVDVAPTADLSVTKSAAPNPLDTTQPATYTITVHNDGPQTAAGTVVVDQLPAALTITAVTPSQGSCDPVGAAGTLSCALGPIANGADATITVQGTLAGAAAGIVVANSARVTSTTGDPDPTNNTATTTTTVIPAADLELAKTTDTAAPQPGATVTFTLTLTNHGPSAATNAQVTDTLPAGLTLVSAPGCTAAGSDVTCAAGTLAAGDQRAFPVTVRVADSLAGHTVTNTATASSDIPDPVAANGTDEATLDVGTPTPAPNPPTTPTAPAPEQSEAPSEAPPSPSGPPPVTGPSGPGATPPTGGRAQAKLRVRKSADRTRVRAGGLVRYRIRVRNVGAAAARRVRVCDRPPAGLVLVRFAGAKLRNGQACWTLSELAAGSARTVRIVARTTNTPRAQRVTNRVVVSARNARTRHDRAPIRVLPATTRPGGVTG